MKEMLCLTAAFEVIISSNGSISLDIVGSPSHPNNNPTKVIPSCVEDRYEFILSLTILHFFALLLPY